MSRTCQTSPPPSTFHPSEVLHAVHLKVKHGGKHWAQCPHTQFLCSQLRPADCWVLFWFLSSPVRRFNQRSALCCSCLQPYNMKHQDRVCDNSFSYNSDINLSKLPMRDCAWFVDASRSAIAMVHAPNSTEMLVKLRCPGNSLKWMCHAINCDMLQYVSICYHAKVIPCLSRFKQAIAPLLLRVNTASSRPETRRLPLTVFGVSKAVPCRRRSLSIWHLFLPPESASTQSLFLYFFVSCLSIAWKKVFHKIFWSIWWA